MAAKQILNGLFAISRGMFNVIAFIAERRAQRTKRVSSDGGKKHGFLSKPAEPVASFPERRSELGPEIGRASPGQKLTFEYADENGEVSLRFVSHWIEHRNYLRGWCETRRAHRTFRKDRVIDWVYGKIFLKSL